MNNANTVASNVFSANLFYCNEPFCDGCPDDRRCVEEFYRAEEGNEISDDSADLQEDEQVQIDEVVDLIAHFMNVG